MTAPKVLLVIAHPVIASGIETLLKLEGNYDIRRSATVDAGAASREWTPDVALVDGTLLTGFTDVRIGAPAYVLSGNERDGRALALRLDDGRGWLRKDATGPELRQAIASVVGGDAPTARRLRTPGIMAVVAIALAVLAFLAYLVWMAMY